MEGQLKVCVSFCLYCRISIIQIRYLPSYDKQLMKRIVQIYLFCLHFGNIRVTFNKRGRRHFTRETIEQLGLAFANICNETLES